MQHSKSHGSFSSGSTTLIPGQRPRARSSLDTFVIPGRTRIPSSKPEPIDIQIAETLLNPPIAWPIRESLDEMSSSERKRDAEAQRLLKNFGIQASRSPGASKNEYVSNREHQHPTSNSQTEESSSLYTLQSHPQTLHKVRPEISNRPPPRIGGREIIIVPPRRARKIVVNTSPKRLRPTPPRKATPPMNQSRGVYDGAIGSSYESRTTSMTWSTISHRFLTDSSESFQGLQASESLNEFNRLALKHGLPEMEMCSGGTFGLQKPLQAVLVHSTNTHSSDEYTKMTEKIHHHNWLARKLFHRTSSTYTLKVKSNQKRLKHKKSLGIIPKLEDPGYKNILKDKSLEEVCRLGGMGVLTLPEGFSVTKQLSLPTCLSATATYLLQHGTNNPGLFRVSSQSSTVSALYEYYAFQFAQAGSPSKVQETVGSGLLPTHIEHSIPDVASLFKKILNALPGGLLGSLELFEAFRSIFFRLIPSPELSESDTKILQAKLIALAISSVASTKRVSLIQAVIGLVAYFGEEAEVARKIVAADQTNREEETQPSSELMGFQALGVVMGPLILGDLVGQLDPALPRDDEDLNQKSFESAKKGDKKTEKKQKRTSFSNKLDRDATLSTHVDRANLTANIMELLLMIWKDVVAQLREPQPRGSSISLEDADKRLRGTRNGAGGRKDVGDSEEDLFLVNMIKGRPLRAGFSGEIKMKRKVKVERSARARSIRRASLRSSGSPATVTSIGELPAGIRRSSPIGAAVISDTVRIVKESDSDTARSIASNTPKLVGTIHEDQRTKSEVAMAQMSMGTILPRLQDSPITPLHKEMLRSVSQPQTPNTTSQTSKLGLSSSGAPETALRDLAKPNNSSYQLMKRSHSSLDKPPPPIGDMTHNFPAQTFGLAQPSASLKPRSRSSTASNSRKSTQAESNQATNGESPSPKPSRQGSVKLLAQRYDDGPRASARAGSIDSNIPKVYAKIYALPTPKKLHRDDPFFSFSDNSLEKSPDKASRIPQPARDAGSVRKDHSRSPSPPKSSKFSSSLQKQLPPNTFQKKCPSFSQLTADSDANLTKENGAERSEKPEPFMRSRIPDREQSAILEEKSDSVTSQAANPQDNQGKFDQKTVARPSRSPPPPPRRAPSNTSQRRTNSSIYIEVAPTRPLSAYSIESLRRMQLADEPPVAQHIPTRVISMGVNVGEPSEVVEVASGSRQDNLKRSGSVNTAMADEIHHLKYLLEQREKDVRETRRSLDALRDSREDAVNISNGTAGSCVSKGTLANELRTARKQTAEWKRRAEWAESRLAVIGQRCKCETVDLARKNEPSQAGEEKPRYWLHE